MNTDKINAIAEVLKAITWPFTALLVLFILRKFIPPLVKEGRGVSFNLGEFGFTLEPARGLRPPSEEIKRVTSQQLIAESPVPPDNGHKKLPFDLYYINHTSFLRRNKQEAFRLRTGVNLDHFDIRVIVDSYYHGAIEKIDRVEYVLHHAYPEPIQFRHNPEDNFLLKELANGEYVLMAKVFLKNRSEPILLQRYITLWESGPKLL